MHINTYVNTQRYFDWFSRVAVLQLVLGGKNQRKDWSWKEKGEGRAGDHDCWLIRSHWVFGCFSAVIERWRAALVICSSRKGERSKPKKERKGRKRRQQHWICMDLQHWYALMMCTWLWDEVHVVFNSFQLGCSWKPGGKNQSSWSWKGEGKAEGGEGWGGKDAWVVQCFWSCWEAKVSERLVVSETHACICGVFGCFWCKGVERLLGCVW